MQVAEIIKTVYFNILSRSNLTVQEELFQLTASTDGTKPVLAFIPMNVSGVEWIKYSNTSISPSMYQYVKIMGNEDFLAMVDNFNPSASEVKSFTFDFREGAGNTFTFQYKNNAQPKFCTVIENRYVIFDSFDTAVDSTIQSNKTRCWGQVLPNWSATDTFIPELDDLQFPLLLNEAKSLAFFELKQQPHSKAEQEAKRQWGTLQKDKSLTNKPTYFDQLPNFGRYGRGYRSSSSQFKARGWDV